jgi:hypothetical protein
MAAYGGKIVRRTKMMMYVDAMKVSLRHVSLRFDSMPRRRGDQGQLLPTRLGPKAIPIDKVPVDLDTEARSVAKVQVAVLQLRVLVEKAERQRVRFRSAV